MSADAEDGGLAERHPILDAVAEAFAGPRVDVKGVEAAVGALLDALGYDWRLDEHLALTPARVARWWREFLDADFEATAFGSMVDEMVVVSGIRVAGVCPHHLLPYPTDVALGYIPRGQVLGLSKLARIARWAFAGLFTQEDATSRAAAALELYAHSHDVAVQAIGEHLCMSIRGVRQPHARTTTTVVQGRFKDQERARAEFLAAIRPGA